MKTVSVEKAAFKQYSEELFRWTLQLTFNFILVGPKCLEFIGKIIRKEKANRNKMKEF